MLQLTYNTTVVRDDLDVINIWEYFCMNGSIFVASATYSRLCLYSAQRLYNEGHLYGIPWSSSLSHISDVMLMVTPSV